MTWPLKVVDANLSSQALDDPCQGRLCNIILTAMSAPSPGGASGPPSPGGPPSPEPFIQPVAFDYDAAQQMSTQLQATANSLNEMAAVIQKELPATTDQWAGTLRADFDVDTMQILAAIQAQAEQYLLMASQIEAGAWEAQATNQSINAQNEAIAQHNTSLPQSVLNPLPPQPPNIPTPPPPNGAP